MKGNQEKRLPKSIW